MHRVSTGALLFIAVLAGRSLVPVGPLTGQTAGAAKPDTTATVQGVVRDAAAQPMAGVAVVALGLGRVTFTDARGTFRLGKLPPGTLELHFRRAWFDLARRIVTVDSGASLQVDLELRTLVPVWCEARARNARLACPEQVAWRQ